jgi:hypothetical protein
MKLGIKKRVFLFLENNLSEEHYMCFRQLHGWFVSLFFEKDTKNWHGYFLKRKRNNEKYYVIRITSDVAPFAAWRMCILSYDWAIKKGYIPIIDIEHAEYFRSGRKSLGKDNIWEDIFVQAIPTKEVYNKKWVWVEYVGVRPYDKKTCLDLNGNAEEHLIHATMRDWRNYYSSVKQMNKSFGLFREEIVCEFKDKYSKYFANNDIILGVCLREEFSKEWLESLPDSSKAKEVYQRHPLGPSVEDIISIVKRNCEKWKCNKIFVTTLYQETIERFKNEFGENIIYIDRKRKGMKVYINNAIKQWEYDDKEWVEYRKRSRTEERRRNETYAQEIIGLSKCDYFIGAPCSATMGALGLNGGNYKDIYLLEDYNKSDLY